MWGSANSSGMKVARRSISLQISMGNLTLRCPSILYVSSVSRRLLTQMREVVVWRTKNMMIWRTLRHPKGDQLAKVKIYACSIFGKLNLRKWFNYRVATELELRNDSLINNFPDSPLGGCIHDANIDEKRETVPIGPEAPECDHDVIVYSFVSHYPLLRHSRCVGFISGV